MKTRKPKSTPGPWSARYDETTRGLPSWRIDSPSISILAALTYPSAGDKELAAEVAANAKLIAAAPELVDALKGVSRYLHSLVGVKLIEGPTIREWINVVDSAILKAGH